MFKKIQGLLNEVPPADTLHFLGFISKATESTCTCMHTHTHKHTTPSSLQTGKFGTWKYLQLPSPTWNAFFVQVLEFQYLSVGNGKFIDVGLQCLAMIKFIFLVLHCLVLFYLPNGSSPIYEPIKLQQRDSPKLHGSSI